MLLNINRNLPQKEPPKNDNFSHFATHRLIKKNALLQLPSWPTICFFTCLFWNQKIDVEQKHNLKSGKGKIEKGIWKRKQDRKLKKKRKDWWKKKLCTWIFWCCSFHETKTKKKEKERKRQKQGTKRKQEGRTRRKKEKKKRETEKDKLSKWEAKRGYAKRVQELVLNFLCFKFKFWKFSSLMFAKTQ